MVVRTLSAVPGYRRLSRIRRMPCLRAAGELRSRQCNHLLLLRLLEQSCCLPWPPPKQRTILLQPMPFSAGATAWKGVQAVVAVVAAPRFLNKDFPLMGLTASRMAL